MSDKPKVKRPRRVKSQKELLTYLRKLTKPRWRLRIPIKDKRGPFLYPLDGQPIPGRCVHVSPIVFYALRAKGRLRILKIVDTAREKYREYGIQPK